MDENRRNADISLDLTSLNTQPISQRISNLQKEMDKDNGDRSLLDISREASVKDLTERLQVNCAVFFKSFMPKMIKQCSNCKPATLPRS